MNSNTPRTIQVRRVPRIQMQRVGINTIRLRLAMQQRASRDEFAFVLNNDKVLHRRVGRDCIDGPHVMSWTFMSAEAAKEALNSGSATACGCVIK